MISKVTLCIFIILLTITFLDFNIQYNKLKTLEGDMWTSYKKNEEYMGAKDNLKENSQYDLYREFYNDTKKLSVTIETVNVGGGEVSASLIISHKEDYSVVTEAIGEKYNIIEISPLKEEDGKMVFEVKVNKNDL